jgi:hypothetical protein
MRYQPRNSLPLRTELCTWPSKRVAIRFGPRSRERRMPRAPRRCLGTAPKFPCAVSELIQQKCRCRKARTCFQSFGAFAPSGLSCIKHANSHCSCTMATYRWAALRQEPPSPPSRINPCERPHTFLRPLSGSFWPSPSETPACGSSFPTPGSPCALRSRRCGSWSVSQAQLRKPEAVIQIHVLPSSRRRL